MSSSGGGISSYIGKKWATVLAVAALAAGAVVIPAVTTESALPSGVTLTEPDGGADYYQQWSQTTSWDESFFPIALFGMFDLGQSQPVGMTRVAGHKDAGVNIYLNLANGFSGSTTGGTDGGLANANGMYVIADPTQSNVTSTGLGANANAAKGWLYGDEIDGHTCSQETGTGGAFSAGKYAWIATAAGITCSNDPGHGTVSPTFLKQFSNQLRALDTTRPVFMGYTHPWAWHNGCASPCTDFVAAGDVLGYDVYVLVDRRFTSLVASSGHPYAAYDSIQLARSLNGTSKPIWPDLETSATDTGFNTGPTVEPTDAQLQALAWQYIIGGARGLTWFNICICSGLGYNDFDVINNTTRFPTRHAAIKTVNTQIQTLAPVINSDFANGYVSVTSGAANIMAKWVPAESAFYVFAGSDQTGSQTVTFQIAGSPTTTATKVGPTTGTVFVTAGSFSDTFSGETAVHIYKIPNG